MQKYTHRNTRNGMLPILSQSQIHKIFIANIQLIFLYAVGSLFATICARQKHSITIRNSGEWRRKFF